MPSLSDPIRIGAIDAKNRVFMAPLTRGRATAQHVPTPIMVEYYRQRAGAGLILTEATGISQEGLGWPFAPGIWSDAQAEAWKPVVKAVHDRGGRIVCQLWHMGRLVHPDFLGGERPVSASASPAPAPAHTHAGTQIAAITTGTLRYTVIKGKPVKVLKPNALGTKPEFIRTIKAGQTYDVKAGYSVIEPAGTAHKVQGMGATEVVIYVASLFTNGEPVSIPYVTAS